MEEQKKAKEIVEKYYKMMLKEAGFDFEDESFYRVAIKSAIIHVEGIIEVLKNEKEAHYRTLKYWQKVLTEIKQL